MKEIVIRINTENDAFQGPLIAYEVCRILRHLIDEVRDRGLDRPIVLSDVNGNRVGEAKSFN